MKECKRCYHLIPDEEYHPLLGCPLCGKDPTQEYQFHESKAKQTPTEIGDLLESYGAECDGPHVYALRVGHAEFTFYVDPGKIEVETVDSLRTVSYNDLTSYLNGVTNHNEVTKMNALATMQKNLTAVISNLREDGFSVKRKGTKATATKAGYQVLELSSQKDHFVINGSKMSQEEALDYAPKKDRNEGNPRLETRRHRKTEEKVEPTTYTAVKVVYDDGESEDIDDMNGVTYESIKAEFIPVAEDEDAPVKVHVVNDLTGDTSILKISAPEKRPQKKARRKTTTSVKKSSSPKKSKYFMGDCPARDVDDVVDGVLDSIEAEDGKARLTTVVKAFIAERLTNEQALEAAHELFSNATMKQVAKIRRDMGRAGTLPE